MRLGGYEIVFKTLAKDIREHNFIIMIKAALVCKVCQQWTRNKCQFWDHTCGPSRINKVCFAAFILEIAEGID